MVFARLATVAKVEKGHTGIQKSVPGQYPLVTLALEHMTSAEYQFDAAAAIVPLISSTGHGHASLNRMHYQEGKFALGNILCAVIPFAPEFISARFIYEYLWAYRERLLIAKMIGTANVGLTLGKVGEAPIPIISPDAQTRLYELMILCDQLGWAQEERERRRHCLTKASLLRVNDYADAEPSRKNAVFYLQHFPRLTTCQEQIQQLRQIILNLAVRGQLITQDPNEDPIAATIALNDQTRQTTAKEDRRADADLQTILAAEERWSVPSTWEWRALADLVLFIDYRGHTPIKVEQGVRLLTAKNVKKGFINLSPEEFLSEANYPIWMTRGLPKEGDVLFTTEAPMGNAAVVRLSERFALAQRVICFRLYGAMHPDFLVLQIIAEPFQSILDKTGTGLTAKGIKAAKLKRLPIAVPPLAEQNRIVAKVNELMALCDQLEAQLTVTQTESRRLLEAILQQALTPEA